MFDSTNLTRNQFLIWTGHQASPQHSIYNEVTTFIIDGAVDRVHFEQAMRHVVDRTDALRMVVREVDGVPQLEVQERGGFTPGYVDLSDRDDPEAALGEWGRTRAAVPFDITQRTFEAWLVKLSDKKAAWYLLQHHILSDATSMSIVFRRVSDAYSRSQAGTLVETGEFPRFEDYVAYEKAYRGSPRGQKAEAYWAGKAAERSEPVRFYGATERAGLGSWEQERVRVELSREQSQAIRELARRPGIHLLSEDFSVFSVFAAVLVSYLHRLSSHERITIGVPWQNRPAQFADTVGLLMEQDPFSVAIQPGDTFHELIRRAQAEALDVMRHLPYAAGNPGGRLYDVVLNFLKVSIGKFAGMPVRPLWLHSGAGDGSLIVNVHDLEASGHFAVEFDFNCEVFEDDDRRRAIQHFTNLLDQCVSDASLPIDRASILSDSERHRILVEWNATQREYPTNAPLHELVERQSRRTPEAVAVVARDRTLTYNNLEADANRISRALRLRGVKPTDHVGVCLPRSFNVVTALLGTLKAGAAIVPMDPGYPVDRLSFMLEDCGAAAVLTDRRTSELLSRISSTVPVIILDEIAEDGAVETRHLPHRSGPDDPAYIIYTSGSTGRPKGVVVPHRGICNHVNWMSEALSVGVADRFLHKTSISFDAAMAEIFVPLNVGGAVVIGAADEGLDPGLLASDIEDGGVTVMQVVPSALRTLLREPVDVFGGKSLRYLICGGEALERALAAEFQSRYPGVKLGNFYGPTEASIDATWNPLTGPLSGGGTIPIGRPIANTRCYVLDQAASPVPIGIIGQLYVAGAGLANGYWRRSELTAASFVNDPFHLGERMYATGDLARYLPNGELEYRGRLNEQVKVRGYRIELGEIESALALHERVSQCVVIVREDEPGDRRLVAYLVERAAPAGAGFPTVATLREHLRRTLPEYMVPQHFVSLEAIPVLPNGKVDRRALPAPTDPFDGGTYVAPRSNLEAAVAQIWCEVLRVHRVGVHDNFVELGGHSLTAAQVVSRLRATLGVEVSLRALFELPTVAGQAASVAALMAASSPSSSASDWPVPPAGPAPLTYAQEGLWILDRLERLGGLYNIPLTLELTGPMDEKALDEALQKVVARHETLRTVMEDRDGKPAQVVLPHLVVPLQVVAVVGDTVSQREQEAARLLEASASEEFDLSRGPLLRARLLRLDPETHILQVVVHHIVSDGWSMDVLKRELGALYHATRTGQDSPLGTLAVQFRAYAHWQRDFLTGERLERELGYWQHALAGLGPLELPSDMPRGRRGSYRGAIQRLTVSAEIAAGLRRLSRTQNATLFMVVLAAFKVLLMRYSGQDDLAVGAPVAGRDRPELENLIGYFLNTVVLRTNLSGNPTFEELLGRVRETALDAYAHQALPFETLVARISPERQLGKNPLFQVMINHLDGPAQATSFGDLRATERPVGGSLAKFPLTLYVTDSQSELTLALAHQLDLFSESWARVLLDQLNTLFKRILEAPSAPIGGYDLWDHESILPRPDPSLAMAVPEYSLVVDMFCDVASRAPDATALCFGDHSWSYGDVGRISLGLAAELESRGVRRGDVVAIHGTRSPGVVMAMLATLANGAVVLTVDPTLPRERRLVMMRTAGARWHVRVGDTSLPSGEEPLLSESSVVHIEASPQTPGRFDAAGADFARSRTADGNDGAYIFFTSGSTGQPKAVLGTHRGLAQFLWWERSEFLVGPGDRVSNLISLSFDPLLRDIFLPLTSGATLCIPEEQDLLDVIGWLRRSRVSLMHATPSLLQAWMGQGSAGSDLPFLRWTVLAGEPLADVLIEQWRQRCGHSVAVANLYGPTETTLARCFERIEGEPDPGIQPVGRPIPDTQVLILNPSGVQCSANEVGEVVIRTPFRSRGYLGLEDETRRRFRPSPFSNEATDLLYFTGDVGRIRPDGRLALAGRMDDQVKIRGVRVEPGEVAAVLARHDAVGSAVVLPQRRGNEYALAAYVALK
ncbi:MAG TPA: amino acid adenylation domain-containing protein, partial [Baekduia sp.]|nr:amino acid adenylation domain-containing protein [Baekduia sp.]